MPATLPRRMVHLLGDRQLGPVALALFVHGLGQGLILPLIALWLDQTYHGGPGLVAAYFACTALGGLGLNPLLGRLSDRLARRRGTGALAAAMQAASALLLALHPPLAVVLAGAAVLGSAQVQPHLFSLVHDHIGAGSADRPRGLTIATLRSTISAAWVVGAPLGGALASHSWPALFVLATLCQISSLLVIVARCREGSRAPARGPSASPAGPVRWGPLLLFSVAATLTTAGNTAKMQTVPVYLTHLGLAPALVGLVFGWMAFGELVLMPPVGQLADRVPRRRLVALGALGGALFFGILATVPRALAVVAAFPLMSFYIAALYGVGIGYAQDLDPDHPGLAGGMFFAAQGLGSALGGPLVAGAQVRLGLPAAFAAPGLAIALGCVGVLLTSPQRDARPPQISAQGTGAAALHAVPEP